MYYFTEFPWLLWYYSQIIVDNKEEYFWRANPWPQQCSVDASPASPSPVTTTTIDVFDFHFSGGELFLNMSWQPPPAPHGRIEDYQLIVLAEETETSGTVEEPTILYTYNTNVSSYRW